MVRKTMSTVVLVLVTGLLLSACGQPHYLVEAAPETTTAPTYVLPPPSTPQTTMPVLGPAVATKVAVRVVIPTETAPQYDEVYTPACANPDGLFCLPFYDGDPTDLCAEFRFYHAQQNAAARLGDQPRSGPKTRQGIGWRESNCKNTVVSSTGCCYGYFQINPGNIRAYGYASSGLWAWCGITRLSDYYGSSPLQKQKSVCAAVGIWNYHLAEGQDPAYEAWDKWL